MPSASPVAFLRRLHRANKTHQQPVRISSIRLLPFSSTPLFLLPVPKMTEYAFDCSCPKSGVVVVVTALFSRMLCPLRQFHQRIQAHETRRFREVAFRIVYVLLLVVPSTQLSPFFIKCKSISCMLTDHSNDGLSFFVKKNSSGIRHLTDHESSHVTLSYLQVPYRPRSRLSQI